MRKMAIVSALAFMAFATTASGLVVNGDWNTGDETGWTRWNSPWGGPFNWSVDPTEGQLPSGPPSGKLVLDNGSFGWYQFITVIPDEDYTIVGCWKGINVGWAEIIFANDDGRAVYDQLDAPTNIACKRDGGATFDWEDIQLSQLDGTTIHTTGTQVLVGLKLGQSGGGTSTAWFDNIDAVPEPTAVLLLGLPMLFLRRRR